MKKIYNAYQTSEIKKVVKMEELRITFMVNTTLITSWNTQLVGFDKMSQRTSTERTKSGGNNITCNTFCGRIIINLPA